MATLPANRLSSLHKQSKSRPLQRWAAAGAIALGLRLGLRLTTASLRARLNPTTARPPYDVPEAARRLHDSLLIADLHSDALLWGMDLRRRSARGHVDIPRLLEGNVALQVFSAVTRVPPPERDATFGTGPDLVLPLSVAELWPPATWLSLKRRALYQARRLARTAERCGGVFTLVKSRQHLNEHLRRRAAQPGLTAGLLSLEGAQGLASDPHAVDDLFQAGFRIVGLTHFFDNEVGGASWGKEGYGLTTQGRALVEQLEARSMILDLAHAAPALIEDVLKVATRPVLVTHTGVQGVCPQPRNLDDRTVKQVATRGGLIGIGYGTVFHNRAGVEPIVDSIKYVKDLVGIHHVALGSDFDGAITAPFDASGLALLTDALMRSGLSDRQIRAVMGENVIQFLLQNLP